MPVIENKKECQRCRDRRSAKQKNSYHQAVQSGTETKKAKRQRFKDEGLCSRCGKEPPATGLFTCTSCLDQQRRYHHRLKDEVFEAYGGYRCVCCGESTKEFLTLDHIHNDGSKHRELFGGRNSSAGFSYSLYLWIIKNNFPPIFQVLCANCNWGKRLNGICPHQWITD